MSQSRETILEQTRNILMELFEIERTDLKEDALLYEDLDIDSIDAVDLLIELKRFTGKDIQPHSFNESRTLGDIVSVIAEH